MPDAKQIDFTELKLSVDASSMFPAISAAVGEARLLYGDLVTDDDLATISRDCTSVGSERAEARLVLTFDHEKFIRRCAILAKYRQAGAFCEMTGALYAVLAGESISDEKTGPMQKVKIGSLDV